MSVYVTTAVWRNSQAKGVTRLILLSLADQANDDGECWPSLDQIATRCLVDRATVHRHLIKLRDELHELEWETRRTQGRSSLYRVVVPSQSQIATTPVADCDPPQSQIATEPVADCDEGRRTVATTGNVIEPSVETSGKDLVPPTITKIDTSRGSRLPVGWLPQQATIDKLTEQFPRVDQRAEFDKFTDYWRAQPGAKGRKTDWEATWRNWVRSSAERLGPGRGMTTRQQAERSRQDQIWDQLAAEGDR